VIVGLLASFAFRQSNTAAQTAENETASFSPDASTFLVASNEPITINDTAPASPYPSSIFVSGFNPATVTRVEVLLLGFTHTFPDDVDIVLVAPDGRRTVLMSDAGGDADVSNINLRFSPAAAVLPDSSPPALATGTYRPTNYDNSNGTPTDTFPAPFPAPNTLTNAPADLSVFNLTNPNGQWSLYVVDDTAADVGSINLGWQLLLTVPTVFTVNSTADAGSGGCTAAECTLREAIAAAQSDDLINFSPLFDTPQIININEQLVINKNLTIAGKGANLLTIRNVAAANANSRVFQILNGFTAELSGMTVTGGNPTGSGGGIRNFGTLTLRFVHVTGNTTGFGNGFGGGIRNNSGGTLNIISSTVSNNTANGDSTGGGIESVDTLTVTNSTISGNRAPNGDGNGGGIWSGVSATITITNSTITGNEAAGANSASGVYRSVGTITVRNSIIAANRNNSTTPDVYSFGGGGGGGFVSQGFNLIGNRGAVTNFTATGDQTGTGATLLNPLLAPLAPNGGTTPTHAILLATSPALDKGSSSGFSTDQRGSPRPVDLIQIPNAPGGDGADIGAFEAQTAPTTAVRAPFDYDGDGRSDVSVFRPSNGVSFGYSICFSGRRFDGIKFYG
jgi:CSLREA domain-containing protein